MAILYTLVLHGGETHIVSNPNDFAQIMLDENALQLNENEWNAVFDVSKCIQSIKALKPGGKWRNGLCHVECEEFNLEWLPSGDE